MRSFVHHLVHRHAHTHAQAYTIATATTARARAMSTTPATATATTTASSIERIVRVRDASGREVYGELDDAAAAGGATQDARVRVLRGDPRDVFARTLTRTDEYVRAAAYLSPVPIVNVLCIGLNYRRHAMETNMREPSAPILFMKGVNAVTGHLQPIVIPAVCADANEVDYEVELGVIIGGHDKPCKNVREEDALDYVLGYTVANDVSARKQQLDASKSGGQWCRGKTFDTFAPVGPSLVYASSIRDPQSLDISLRLNGTVMQRSHTSDMIFSVRRIIAYLSQSTTLVPGTLILTGTPEGVGFARQPPLALQPNDVCEATIESIGTLTNPVLAE